MHKMRYFYWKIAKIPQRWRFHPRTSFNPRLSMASDGRELRPLPYLLHREFLAY